ncbi:sugar-binding protein [Paenibacillus oryzisoli]|uniref:sugar-binding protein n=1 Tax=Paenibacillus oryzisoli TaxID=1850517 RepID=UPI003D27F319
MRSQKWFSRTLVVLLVFSMVISFGAIQPKLASAATLFSDDFEDGDAAGWSIVNGGATNFSVVSDDTMVYKIQYASGGITEKIAVAGNAGWTNYAVEAKVKLLSGSNAAVIARYVNKDNFYVLRIDSSNDKLELSKRVNGTFSLLSETAMTLNSNTAYTLKLSVNGTNLIGFVDGVQKISASDTAFSAGKIGTRGTSSTYTLDNVTVSDPTPNYIAKKTLSPLSINGILDESVWSMGQSASKVVQGVTDNTVTYGALWDDKYLYVGVKVLDGNLYNDSLTDSFDDDSVELFIDADHSRGITYDLKDWQLRKRYNDTGLFEKLNETVGVKHAWSAIAGGYAIEMAIPWINLGITPAAQLSIGFDIAVNDDDNGGVREGQLVWSGTADNWQNTSALGDLTLSSTTVGTTPTPPTLPQPVNRYVTPQGAGSKDGSSWANAFKGDQVGGLQAAWDATGITNTLYVGSGTYIVPQTLSLTRGGTDVLHMKKLIGVDTGGGLPEFKGDFTLPSQGSRKFIDVPLGVSYWWIQDIVIGNYFYGIYVNGQSEGIRIYNVSVHDMSDGVYFWGKATRSNLDAGTHDIVVKGGNYTNYTKRAIRFRNGNYMASVIGVNADAGGQANWYTGNFPFGFSIGNSPAESPYIFDHDILFQDVTARNSWHQDGTSYWNGDGFTAERSAYNLTYVRSKAFDSTDGGYDDKSKNPVFIDTVSFGNKRNYRLWSADKATLIRAIGGYSFKRGGSGDALNLHVTGDGNVDAYYSTFWNSQNSEIGLENANTVNINNSIIGKNNGTSLYNLSGGQLNVVNSDAYILGVQGTDPQFVNGGNSAWEGGSSDFNSQAYGNTKGYTYPGPNNTPYTVQINSGNLALGLYGSSTISAQVLDSNNNPVADPENIIWYSKDGFISRILQSRGPSAIVQGLNAGTTEVIAVYKGDEAKISVTVN